MKARFYFDIISPFAYFYVKLRHRLEPRLQIEPVPVLLGGLLRAARNQGPGEIPTKRLYSSSRRVFEFSVQVLGVPHCFFRNFRDSFCNRNIVFPSLFPFVLDRLGFCLFFFLHLSHLAQPHISEI